MRVGPFYLLRPPSAQERARVEASCKSLPFNFPHVGVTQQAPPLKAEVAREGWCVDHTRTQIGSGRAAYQRAQELLKAWRHFDLGWAFVNNPPVERGAPVVVTALSLFCWSCNPLRIAFVEEGARRAERAGSGGGPPARGRRYAFGHTTLQGHQICGEERFAVEWNQRDDLVWYEIYTLSRPATPISMLAFPLLRFFQRKFGVDSSAAMRREMAATGQTQQRQQRQGQRPRSGGTC